VLVDVDDGARLHIVTGKGGTGKTTIAAALALALASGGRRTLLCEVEGRQQIAQLFGIPPLPYEERGIAVAPQGGDVFALAVEPEAALLEYLSVYYHLGRAGKVLERIGAIEVATTIAPGLRDVLITGKVYEAVRRRGPAGFAYDAVVLDAPPTGRIGRFLNATEGVASLAKGGMIHSQADSIMTALRSPRTVIHLVTVLEEMPVQETRDAVAELETARLGVGGIVVNMVREPVLPPDALDAATTLSLDKEAVATGLRVAGLAEGPADGPERLCALADGLLAEACEHARKVGAQTAQSERLAGLGLPVFTVPALVDGIDLGALHHLADLLADQGMHSWRWR
jgi:anion-transporting  ArsA/GET3 family ATPase